MNILDANQQTFKVVGDYASSLGKRAVKFFESIGVRFYPCQKTEMELFIALALLPEGTDLGTRLHYETLEYTVTDR